MNFQYQNILVTGATGFLGTHLCRKLVQIGYGVTAFVRKSSNVKKLKLLNINIVTGDIKDIASLEVAFKDINIVIHVAAETKGNIENSRYGTIEGTQNIKDLCNKYQVKRLIYLSSCSVYQTVDIEDGELLDENSLLESKPDLRGIYSESKLLAEKIITDDKSKVSFEKIVIRPGIIWGNFKNIISPTIGLVLKNRLLIVYGNGSIELPFVYIENLVNAIILFTKSKSYCSGIYNIIDNTKMTKKEYINKVIKNLFPTLRIIYIPLIIFRFVVYLTELLAKVIKMNPPLTRYRFESSQKHLFYSDSKIKNLFPSYDQIDKESAIMHVINLKSEVH